METNKLKKLFEIRYEVVGGRRDDVICFYAKGIKEAIDMFEKHEHGIQGVKFEYSQHAIISIQ